MHHEKENTKRIEAKRLEIESAVKYCRENNCKGYRAIADLNLQYVKDPQTINSRLSGKVTTGDEKS